MTNDELAMKIARLAKQTWNILPKDSDDQEPGVLDIAEKFRPLLPLAAVDGELLAACKRIHKRLDLALERTVDASTDLEDLEALEAGQSAIARAESAPPATPKQLCYPFSTNTCNDPKCNCRVEKSAASSPPAATSKLTQEQREDSACDVCGNTPDEDGMLEHGRGCYVVSEDGGGTSYVETPIPPAACREPETGEPDWTPPPATQGEKPDAAKVDRLSKLASGDITFESLPSALSTIRDMAGELMGAKAGAKACSKAMSEAHEREDKATAKVAELRAKVGELEAEVVKWKGMYETQCAGTMSRIQRIASLESLLAAALAHVKQLELQLFASEAYVQDLKLSATTQLPSYEEVDAWIYSQWGVRVPLADLRNGKMDAVRKFWNWLRIRTTPASPSPETINTTDDPRKRLEAIRDGLGGGWLSASEARQQIESILPLLPLTRTTPAKPADEPLAKPPIVR